MQTGIVNIDTQVILDSNLRTFKSNGFNQVFVAHLGGINQDLINRLSEQVEEMLFSAGAKKATIKRIFSIVVEGLQNILLHGDKFGDEQLCLLIVGASPTAFKVSMGNITSADNKEKLTGYVEKLNSLDEAGVKEVYLETLNNGLISEKGGAGLGFITMRMKSKNPLGYDFKEWKEDQVFFVVTTMLNKEEI